MELNTSDPEDQSLKTHHICGFLSFSTCIPFLKLLNKSHLWMTRGRKSMKTLFITDVRITLKQTGGLNKNVLIYYLMVLEARCLKSRCQQGHTPYEGSRKKSFCASSLIIMVVNNRWHSLPYNGVIWISASVIWWRPPLCSSLCLCI